MVDHRNPDDLSVLPSAMTGMDMGSFLNAGKDFGCYLIRLTADGHLVEKYVIQDLEARLCGQRVRHTCRQGAVMRDH